MIQESASHWLFNRQNHFVHRALLVVAGALATVHVQAQPVVVDEWAAPQIFLQANDLDGNFRLVEQQGTMIGGWRRILLENTGQEGNVQLGIPNGSPRVMQFGETSTAEGARGEIIWDGAAGPRDGLNQLIPVAYDASNNVSQGLNFGLEGPGGTNLSLLDTCGGPFAGDEENRFAVLVRPDDALPVPLTFNIYTSATAWSSMTVSIPADPERDLFIAEFPFTSFTAQGNNNATPANFSDVTAIQLVLIAADQSPSAPIVENVDLFLLETCGFDFGDAPENPDRLGANYSTRLEVKADLSGSPNFVNNNTAAGPYHRLWGPSIGTAALDTDSEPRAQINSSASADDSDTLSPVFDDEPTLVFPPIQDVGLGARTCDGLEVAASEYCVAVPVVNPTDSTAQLVGWIDFSAGGVFSTECTTSDGVVGDDRLAGILGTGWTCNRSASTVRIGNTGLSDQGGSCSASTLTSGDTLGGVDFTTGNIPAHCAGVVILVWNIQNAVETTSGETFARFRITTDGTSPSSGFFTAAGPLPTGRALDGEVEDHLIGGGTLPVSIHSFDSRYTRDGLVIEWGTVSETRNIGFHLWGDRGDGLELLTEELVPSKGADAVQPQSYSVTIPGAVSGDISSLAITAVDNDGSDDVYGFFEAGQSYGKKFDPAPIAWDQLSEEVTARMAERRLFGSSGGSDSRGNSGGFGSDQGGRGSATAVTAVDVVASGKGLHEITWADLANAGLDLSGVSSDSIAVTLKGQPVPRDIVGQTAFGIGGAFSARGSSSPTNFDSTSAIRFWAEAPQLPDALYVDQYTYRISIDPNAAVPASENAATKKPGPATFNAVARVNEDLKYEFGNPLPDPWYAKALRADSSNSTYSTEVSISRAVDATQPANVRVVLGGWTEYNADPDHRVQVLINGQLITDETFDGSAMHVVDAYVPAGLLVPGANNVQVIAPGGTAAPFDIFLVDSIELSYASALHAENDRILLEDMADTGGLTIRQLSTTSTAAYAWTGESLVRLAQAHFGRGSVSIPSLRADGVDYWVSSVDSILSPSSVQGVALGDPLEGISGNLLVIAHPAFLPISPDEVHPLNNYLSARQAEGWAPAVFDVQEVQTQYGHGMPLPQAINAFLKAADERMEFDHVLLVGGDSYDYRDKLELGSISYIPTHYAATQLIRHTPADSLLADLDGDGLSDKALGRWPVRSLSDLTSIVEKTLAWEGDPEQLNNAVWVADSEDPKYYPFAKQVEGISSILVDQGWATDSIAQVLMDELTPPAGTALPDAARSAFFNHLEQGRSLSGFVGHGAPAMWTFQGLLTPDDIKDLYNEGAPTLIGTMTCYTTYFVSPFSDTVAHRWMNGYREDAQGNPIPGVPNGAVAIHGATTLSNYTQNGWFASQVLKRQLSGETLGQAIQVVRGMALDQGAEDQVVNWTLLGDPSIRID